MDTGLYAISILLGRISLTGVYATRANGGDRLLGEDLVGPFDQRHEFRRLRERRVLSSKVVAQDPTGPRARASDVDRDAMLDELRERLRERSPPDRHDRAGDD